MEPISIIGLILSAAGTAHSIREQEKAKDTAKSQGEARKREAQRQAALREAEIRRQARIRRASQRAAGAAQGTTGSIAEGAALGIESATAGAIARSSQAASEQQLQLDLSTTQTIDTINANLGATLGTFTSEVATSSIWE